jgi:hypothetical protein
MFYYRKSNKSAAIRNLLQSGEDAERRKARTGGGTFEAGDGALALALTTCKRYALGTYLQNTCTDTVLGESEEAGASQRLWLVTGSMMARHRLQGFKGERPRTAINPGTGYRSQHRVIPMN